jgi:hypothetical protein
VTGGVSKGVENRGRVKGGIERESERRDSKEGGYKK